MKSLCKFCSSNVCCGVTAHLCSVLHRRPTAIQSAIALKKPAIVLLTGSTEIAYNEFAQSIHTLEKLAQVHEHISFYIGGAGTEAFYEQFQLKALKLARTIDDILPPVSLS